MVMDLLLFVFRLLGAGAICAFVWTFVKPKNQFMRIVRAALLVCCLLVVLLVLRSTGAQ